jgi:predicted MFS family arabinose efflux permease
MFSVSAFQAIVTYSVSFFRQKLQLSTGFATVYFAGASPFFILGSLLSGRLVKRVGRKTLTVVSAFLAGIFTMLFSNITYIPVSMAFALASFVFNGMRNTAVNNLTQEQIPRLRGLMMSLYSAADNIGMAIGAGIGGYILLLYDYDILGLSLGLLGILSAIIFYFYTKDPTLPKVETLSKMF